MGFRFWAYLRFLWHSKNEHGVHSPFVFSLVTKCLYDRSEFPEYKTLERFRSDLLSDHRLVDVTDFGAGSKVFRSNRRAVSAMARHAGISRKRARLLFRTVRYFRPDTILEIGTSVGLATSALALGKPDARVITVEGCPETAAVAAAHLQAAGLANVTVVNAEFSSFLSQPLAFPSPQLVFFDGHHTEAATLAYFEALLPHATDDSVWIFDDIHWSAGMERAWNAIKRHPAVTVTMDTYQWGLVFFRKGQAREDFVIRS